MDDFLTIGEYCLTEVRDPKTGDLLDLSDVSAVWRALLDMSSADFVICGLAAVVVKVEVKAGQVVLAIELDTDFGRVVLPAGAPVGVSHYFLDDQFIPLQTSDRAGLEQLLRDSQAIVGGTIDRAKFFLVVYLAGELDLQLEIDEGVAETLQVQSGDVALPEIRAELYPYQRDGSQWLIHAWELGMGAILADEMGLGKTLQGITLIAHVFSRTARPRVLVVCPATLTRNWESEISRFALNLVPYTHIGRDRRLGKTDFNSKALVITTYDTLRVDYPLLASVDWDLVVCDEAQALKNAETKRNGQVAELVARSKVLMTGTPVENSPGDLGSLVNIAIPGMLGGFEQLAKTDSDNLRFAKLLGQVCAPAVLRREVKDVARDLPELIVQDEPLAASDGFADLYEQIRLEAKDVGVLPTITRLQQLCCSPRLLGPEHELVFDTKLARLHEICREVFEFSSEKMLIFTTFSDSVDLILTMLREKFGGRQAESIDGRSKPTDRQALVERFNSEPEPRFLVINPRAGGSGLNLQGANHVIHFNPQWNPQLEKQATARAFRRGQDKPVWVRNFFYSGTVEEVVRDRLELKLDLATVSLEDSVVTDDESLQKKILQMSPRS